MEPATLKSTSQAADEVKNSADESLIQEHEPQAVQSRELHIGPSATTSNTGVMSDKTMLVLGATSDIAIATMQLLSKEGWGFHLAGRDVSKLESLANDLSVRCGYTVTYSKFDTDMSVEEQIVFWRNVIQCTTPANKPVSSLDGLLCAIGYMGQYTEEQQHKLNMHQQVLRANFGGIIPVLEMSADYFEQKHSGHIIVISSVAGDRGRASNYPYGSAKAAMTAYLSGLRARLFSKNVHVMTVLPGFVRTKMIAHIQTPPKLTASPEQVGHDILKGMHKHSNVVYSKWIWRYIMLVIKHIPEIIFKRLSKL